MLFIFLLIKIKIFRSHLSVLDNTWRKRGPAATDRCDETKTKHKAKLYYQYII